MPAMRIIRQYQMGSSKWSSALQMQRMWPSVFSPKEGDYLIEQVCVVQEVDIGPNDHRGNRQYKWLQLAPAPPVVRRLS